MLNKKDTHRIIIALSFIIPFISILIGFIAGGFKPFGVKDVLTTAGHESMLPYYHELWDNIHEGKFLFFSTKVGNGYDFSAVITYYLSDPTNLIVLLFPKESMLTVLNLLFILKCSLSGLFFFMFINYHLTTSGNNNSSDSNKITDSSITLLSLCSTLSVAYALSSYMITSAMNPTWISAVMIFPLIMKGFEKIYTEGKIKEYIIYVSLSFFFSFRLSVIAFFFISVYLFIPKYENIHKLTTTLFRKLISDFIIFLISSVIIINNITSSFFESDYRLTFPNCKQNAEIPTVIISLFSSEYRIGTFILLISIAFFAIPTKDLWEKMRTFILYGLLISANFITTSNYFFSGMSNSLLNTHVFSYTLLFMSLIMCSEVLRYVLAVPGSLCYKDNASEKIDTNEKNETSEKDNSFKKDSSQNSNTPTMNKTPKGAYFVIILCTLVIIESISASILSLSKNGTKAKQYSESRTASIEKCIDYIHTNDSNAKILIYDEESGYDNPVSNAILGFNYVIYPDTDILSESYIASLDFEDKTDSTLSLYKKVEGASIYYNPSITPGAISLKDAPDTLTSCLYPNEYRVKSEFPYSNLNTLLKESFGSEEVYNEVECKTTVKPNPTDPTNVDSMLVSFSFDKEGEYYVSLTHANYLGTLKAGEEASVLSDTTFEDFQERLPICEKMSFSKTNYDTFLKNISNIRLSTTKGNNEINISIPDSSSSVILPYNMSGCFSAETNTSNNSSISKNNNSNNKTLKIYDYKLPIYNNSESSIKLTYHPSKFYLGMIISIIAFILSICGYVIISKIQINVSFTKEFVKKVENILVDNKVYIYTVIISSLLCTVLFMVKQCVPFGKMTAVISDGYILSYPPIMRFIQNIRSGNFEAVRSMNYSMGFATKPEYGINFPLFFLNPLRLVLLLFPEENFLLGYNLLYILQFILIGPSIIFYLTNRPHGNVMNKNELKLIPIALAYSLSSYVICYYSFFSFLEIAIILPLIILGMERVVYEKKCILYILSLSFIMIEDPYYAFLICEFLLLYFFVIEHKNIISFFKNGIRFAITSILSAVIALFKLVPFFKASMNSGYVDTDSASAKTINYFSHSFLSTLNEFEVTHNIAQVTEDWTKTNTYCGILLILIIPIFLFLKDSSLFSRIRKLLLLILLYISYSNELLNYVFHGFHFQSKVPNRFSIFFIFLLITVFYDIILVYKKIYQTKTVIVTGAFSALIWIIIMWNHGFKMNSCLVTAAFIGSYLIILLMGYTKKKYYICTKILLSILFVEILFSGAYSLRGNFEFGCLSPYKALEIKELVEKYDLNPNCITRTEILNSNNFTTACLIGTNSANTFTSIYQREQRELAEKWNIYSSKNTLEYLAGNPLANIMLNEKYYIFYNDMSAIKIPSYFIQKAISDDITIYEDPYSDSCCYLLPDYIDKININDYNNAFEYQNAICNIISGKDIYDYIDADISIHSTDEKGRYIINITLSEKINGDIYISYNNYIDFLGNATELCANDNSSENRSERKTNNILSKDLLLNEQPSKASVKIAVINPTNINILKNTLKRKSSVGNNIKKDKTNISTNEKDNTHLYIPLPAYDN